jgi:DNA-directed RNA polymerase subunit K/omega
MSDHSDDEYLSDVDVDVEEEDEEEIPIQKKVTKPILPNSFGNTVIDQNIIGDEDNEDYADSEGEEEFEINAGKSSKNSSKSAKGRKRKTKKVEEENESDYDQEIDADVDVEIVEESDDSDEDPVGDDAEEDDDLNDQDYNDEDVDSGEGDDEDSEKYMHQFDKEITKEYILETHPECLPVNMTEVRSMLNVVRNSDGVPIDDFHKTVPIVTKFEKARIIGQRAAQLNSGATPYIHVPRAIDGSTIAEIEFNMKKIPVIIKRPLPNGAFEYWRLKDLEILY